MQVLSAESTEKFVGPADAPLQLARVTCRGCTEPSRIRVDGDSLAGEAANTQANDTSAWAEDPPGACGAVDGAASKPSRPARRWCAGRWPTAGGRPGADAKVLTGYARLDFLVGLRVVSAELGGDAGLVGAAALAGLSREP